jgi:hypothetical protein
MAENRYNISVDCGRDIKKKIEEECKKEGLTQSQYVRNILAKHFGQRNNARCVELWLNPETLVFVVFCRSSILIIGSDKDNEKVKKIIDDYIQGNKNKYNHFNLICSNINDVANVET